MPAPHDADDLLHDWLQEYQQGHDHPLEDFCRDRPDLLPDLRRRTHALRRMATLLHAVGLPTDPATPTERPATPAETGPYSGPLTDSADLLPAPRDDLPEVPGCDILEHLGRGGMADVYLARDHTLRRPAALKVIRPDVRLGPQARQRLQAEAQALARQSHPHILQVYTFGDHQGRPYILQEYVDGGSLARRTRGRPQPPRDAARLVLALARALDHAHRHGILHRDLKPSNVLLAAPADEPALNTPYGCPKLADFGLAQDLDAPGPAPDGGTPQYMAPEVICPEFGPIGPPADVYGLGAILYEMLTGRPPVPGKTVPEILSKLPGHTPVPPRQLRPEVPEPLGAVCMKCLACKPADRYPTAADLAADLQAFLDQPPTPAEVPPPVAPPGPPDLSWWSRVPRAAWLLAALLLVTGLGLASYLATRDRTGPTPPIPSDPVPPGEPPLVQMFQVQHFAVRGDRQTPRGELGQDSFMAAFGDQVRVSVALARPAHLFLVALNADGTEQLCWPQDRTRPPAPVQRLDYPGGGNAFTLNDEPAGGLQGFALVVAREPLPSYAAWRQGRPPVPWEKSLRVPDPQVWLATADGVQVKAPVANQRGQVEELKGSAPLYAAVADLQSTGGADFIEVMAFPVGPK